jgi:hypothetical protein
MYRIIDCGPSGFVVTAPAAGIRWANALNFDTESEAEAWIDRKVNSDV